MDDILKRDLLALHGILEETLQFSKDFLDGLERRPVAPFSRTGGEKTGLLPGGVGAGKALELFRERYWESIPASTGPRNFSYVIGGTTPAALAGDWLTSVFDLSAIGDETFFDHRIEMEALQWVRELLGVSPAHFGCFVTGATVSNFTALAVARQWAAAELGVRADEEGLYGLRKLKVLSGMPHSSVYKALSMLGMGRNCLQLVERKPGREAVSVAALEENLSRGEGGPVIVVANAGTVNTGDFDDLETIVKLRDRYGFWLHVDGAFGGMAASSPRYRQLLAGMDGADSITVDAHKWLNVPYDSAVLFTRHRALQQEVFRNGAAYLGGLEDNPSFLNYTPENSRRLRALPAWFSLLAYGKGGYAGIVERNCAVAEEFGRRLDKAPCFRLLAPVRINVVCFTLAGKREPSMGEVARFLEQVRSEGRTFLTPTVFDGKPAIRLAVSNWRTTVEDIDIAWDSLVRCAGGEGERTEGL